ncbi:acyl CoA:acetate/3-ketoacid CoA transferase [Haloactinopolyspora alba]|uniref:acyl CoA:acetate/3-ketoacid CoA transferase n=1 Tax=Haloactinopolyspora alba TaxID=648780 RepID=UPI000D0E2DE7|nr:CoA-transferase [Haloactinopolyspora alba]
MLSSWSVKPVLSADAAVELIDDAATVFVGGSGGGVQEPSSLLRALARRFETTGSPRELTVWHCSGIGDRAGGGMSLLADDRLVRRVVGAHWGMSPEMAALAMESRIEAYNLPQGAISQLLRETAGGRPGLVTPIGLGTFVDPRLEGGRLNSRTTEDIVEHVELAGSEALFYRAPRIDVALLRATTADECGNLTFEHEAALLEGLALAQATRATGGTVVAQVKNVASGGTLHPHQVRVPGVVVDTLVLDPEQRQTCLREHDPSFTGELSVPVGALPVLDAGPRRVVARRAAAEIEPGAVVNLGVGMPDGVALTAAETGLLDEIAFAVEQGHVGGVPAGGVEFGAVHNAAATLEAPSQFDFFDGGGLDVAFLGMAQVDRHGNVNVSRYGDVLSGSGGFINITQGTRRVVFCGTFTAGGLDVEVRADPAGIRVRSEGRTRKFVSDVEQVTFSGERALRLGQQVLYVTERAVFELTGDGLRLVEVAPGTDIERDVLARMDFEPVVDTPRPMPEAAFSAAPSRDPRGGRPVNTVEPTHNER